MSKASLTFANQTLREIVHVSIGGSLVRVRLSNAYGKEAVEIGGAHIALRQKGAAIVAGSDHVLTFSGQSSVTIPPNALVLSDPIPLRVAPSSDLAISIFLPKSTLGAGIHYSAQQTNYLAPGNVTSAADIPNASTLGSWVFLTGVDVAAPESASTLVAFGDSITDGARSTDNTNHRWPNFLADRLLKQTGAAPIGVLDEGIGGNRILHDPNSNIAFGVNALARFDRDVLAQPGIKYLIVLEGINDLGHAGPNLFPTEQVSAEDIIAGLKQLIERAHEKGIKI
jgi:lysophospholipase L1-like esterase